MRSGSTRTGSTWPVLWTFEAGSHSEAMSIYNRYFGREPYTTDQPWDFTPYRDDWKTED